jgi:RNA polymerase sigma factor (sigma-70 family)
VPTTVRSDDTSLVRGVANGDPEALGAIYDRYAAGLLEFCANVLRRPTEAEDCLREIFVIAAYRLGTLGEPALLRSWLFAVARHSCLVRLDQRRRVVPMDDMLGTEDVAAGAAFDAELAGLLEDAPDGLSDRDRLLLELADRQRLYGDELADAIGVPGPTAETLVARARTAASTGAGAASLVALDQSRAVAAEPVRLRAPILAAVTTPTAIPVAGADWPDDWPPSDPEFLAAADSGPRRWVAPLVVLVVLLLAVGGVLGLLAMNGGSTPVARTPVSNPSSASSIPSIVTAPTAAVSRIPTDEVTTTPPIGAPAPPAVKVVSTPPTPTPTVSTTTSAPAGTLVLTVTTNANTARWSSGRTSVTCPPVSTCAYQLPKGTEVSITADPLLPGAQPAFSAPASCASSGSNTCSFTMTADLKIVLTSKGRGANQNR